MSKETESCDACSVADEPAKRPADAEFADDFAADENYFGNAGLNAFSGETDMQANLKDADARVRPDAGDTDLAEEDDAEFADEEAFGNETGVDAALAPRAAAEAAGSNETNAADEADLTDAANGTATASRYDETLNAESEAYEEYAAEVAPYNAVGAGRPAVDDGAADRSRIRESDGKQAQAGGAVGWIALLAAVASLFIWPAVLGPVAAVLGIVAYARGSKALGVWSIVIGVVALVAYLVIVPLYR